jgi:hypothetical protein
MSALRFAGGTSEHVALGNAGTTLAPLTGSLLAWVYPERLAASSVILGVSDGAGGAFACAEVDADGDLYSLYTRATSNCTTVTTTQPLATTDKWYCVAFTWSTTVGANNEIWVGDEDTILTSVATGGTGSGAVDTFATDAAGIGGAPAVPASTEFGGRIARVVLWNAPQTEETLRQYQWRQWVGPNIVAIWWPGKDGAAATVYDLSSTFSGTAHDGSPTNDPTLAAGPALGPMYGYPASRSHHVDAAVSGIPILRRRREAA